MYSAPTLKSKIDAANKEVRCFESNEIGSQMSFVSSPFCWCRRWWAVCKRVPSSWKILSLLRRSFLSSPRTRNRFCTQVRCSTTIVLASLLTFRASGDLGPHVQCDEGICCRHDSDGGLGTNPRTGSRYDGFRYACARVSISVIRLDWCSSFCCLFSGEIVWAANNDHSSVGPMSGIITPSYPVYVVHNTAFGNKSYSRPADLHQQFGNYHKIEAVKAWRNLVGPNLRKGMLIDWKLDSLMDWVNDQFIVSNHCFGFVFTLQVWRPLVQLTCTHCCNSQSNPVMSCTTASTPSRCSWLPNCPLAWSRCVQISSASI